MVVHSIEVDLLKFKVLVEYKIASSVISISYILKQFVWPSIVDFDFSFTLASILKGILFKQIYLLNAGSD